MNGDISRIPIQSLAGIISLTDVLPELPLPTPTPSSLSSQSLLYDTRLSDDAYQFLNGKDEWLTHSLSLALGSTNTDNIELKDTSSHESVDVNAVPPLLQAIVALNPGVYQGKRGFKPLVDSLSDPSPIVGASQNASQVGVSGGLTSGGEDSSPSKKHKKKKKKKHHKEKKEKKKKHHHHSDDDTEGDRAYSIVQMDSSPNKISMKITLKPKTEEARATTPPQSESHKDKKEKKKKKKDKKHKEKDKTKLSDATEFLTNDLKSPLHNESLNFNDSVPANFPGFNSTSSSINKATGSMLRASLEGNSLVSPLINATANFGSMQQHQAEHGSRVISQQSRQPQASPVQGPQQQQQQSNHILSQLLASMDEVSPASSFQGRQQYPSIPTSHNYPHSTQQQNSQSLIQEQPSTQGYHPNPNAGSQPTNVWVTPQPLAPHPSSINAVPTPGNAVASPLSLGGSYPPTPSPVVNSAKLQQQQNNQQPQTQHQPQLPSDPKLPVQSPINPMVPLTHPPQPYHHSSPASRLDFQGSPYAPGAYHHRGGPGGTGCKPDIYNSPAGTPKVRARPATPVSKGKPDNYTGHMSVSEEKPKKKSKAKADVDATQGSLETNSEMKTPRRRVKRRRNELEELATWHVKDSAYMKPEDAVKAAHDSASVWDNKLGSFTQALGERVKRRKRQARDGVRQTISSFMDEDDEDDDAHSLTGDTADYKGGFGEGGPLEKRRRRKDDDEPFEIRLKDSGESKYASQVIKKSNPSSEIRRRERVTCGLSVNLSLMTTEDLIETGTFKRFVKLVDKVLDAVDDVDLKSIKMDDEHFELPTEARVSRQYLTDLCNESAKLKSVGVMSQVPIDKLIRLMNVLLLNVRDGSKLSATIGGSADRDDEDEERLWREVVVDKVMRSIEAGLAALNIMTSSEMPKEVYVEDVIEQTIQVAKYQLNNCIYPEYDPAYRVIDKAKETHGSIKSKRARERDHAKPRMIIQLYNRLVDVLGSLAQLCNIQQLTDTLILQLSSMGVSLFFVENISEVQLNGLKLLTSIFSQYEKHRQLIMEDILASLARLPSSKKNLRSYRLNSEDSIQMLTALTLLLIQSVVQLPGSNESGSETNTSDQQNGIAMQSNNEEPDDEVVVVKSYQVALRTAHTFLSVFLRKCTVKGEDDYRHVFDNFVNDLLLTVNKPEWPAAEVLLSLLGSLLVQQFSNKSVDQALRVASLDYLGTVASRLRRDAVNSQLSEKDIDEIIKDLNCETSNGWGMDEASCDEEPDKDKDVKSEPEEEEGEEEEKEEESEPESE